MKYERYSKEVLICDIQNKNCIIGDQIIENNLSKINFSGITIRDSELRSLILSDADMQMTQCENMIVDRSDLKGINFLQCKQNSSCFLNSYLIKACFDGSRLLKIQMKNCIAHSISLNNSVIANSVFEGCEMYRIKLNNSVVMNTFFYPGGKEGAIAGLKNASIKHSLFLESGFIGIDLSNSDLSNSSFIDCDFSGSVFYGSNFNGAVFINCNFKDADTSQVDWDGVKYNEQHN